MGAIQAKVQRTSDMPTTPVFRLRDVSCCFESVEAITDLNLEIGRGEKVALALHNWGITGRLMVETVDNMDPQPLTALQSLGASRGQTFLYGALPDVFPGFIFYVFYRWENCIRETVVIGIVGAGGLGRLLSEQLSNFDYSAITTTLIALIILTVLVDLLSATVRHQHRS